jgi:hypothetical protein
LEATIGPKYLRSVDSALPSRFQAELRKKKLADTSISTYLRELGAAMNWAERMGFLAKAPGMDMPKGGEGRTMMRGRPISGEDSERMLAVVEKVRPKDAEVWRY